MEFCLHVCILEVNKVSPSTDYEEHNEGGVEGVADSGSKNYGMSDNIPPWDNSSGSELYKIHHDFIAKKDSQLSVKKGDTVKINRMSYNRKWWEVTNSQGQKGWVPVSCVANLNIPLEEFSWYHGNISRADTELHLVNRVNGTFLIRESESRPGQYSISVNFDGAVFHYRIHKDSLTSKYFVSPQSKFYSLSELVKYYSQNSNGMATALNYPATKQGRTLLDEIEVKKEDIELQLKTEEVQLKETFKAVLKRDNSSVTVKSFVVSCNYISFKKGGRVSPGSILWVWQSQQSVCSVYGKEEEINHHKTSWIQ